MMYLISSSFFINQLGDMGITMTCFQGVVKVTNFERVESLESLEKSNASRQYHGLKIQ